MPANLLIRSAWGLGDSIYSRPFIAAAATRRPVFLDTPWPELFNDLPLQFVLGQRPLRTQSRNILRHPASTWIIAPAQAEVVYLPYSNLDLDRGSVIENFERRLPLPPNHKLVWDLPDMGESPIDTGGAPLAVIRPVTRRREWDNAARNCRPEYIDQIAGDLKRSGYAVLVICDLKVGQEWLVSSILPPHNHALTRGELSARQLLATIRSAAVVVSPVGWALPAGIATGTPTFIVLGGQGGHNGPAKVTDRRMRLSRLGFATPKDFCACSNMSHDCPKDIPNLMQQWGRWRRKMGL